MPEDLSSKKYSLFTFKDLLVTTLISLGYLLFSSYLVGYKSDQLVLIFIFNAFYYASRISRKFILGFSIFIVYWILFDYMKAFPNYHFNKVSIAELYQYEKYFFGIRFNDRLLTPNEYWLINSNWLIDVCSGFFYLTWIPVPLGFAAYLFFRDCKQFLNFAFTFVIVNLIGFVIYYLYPAAPPWYIQQYGFDFIQNTVGNTGGLARFDKYFDLPVFQSIYSKSSNVFAAMPSLHSSYPVIVLYYGLKNRLGIVNVFFTVIMFGIWFTAIYTSHHYMLDVIAGIGCALGGITFYDWVSKQTPLKQLIQKMTTVIS